MQFDMMLQNYKQKVLIDQMNMIDEFRKRLIKEREDQY